MISRVQFFHQFVKSLIHTVFCNVVAWFLTVHIFTRDGAEKNPRAKSNESLMNSEFSKDLDDEMRIVTNSLKNTVILEWVLTQREAYNLYALEKRLIFFKHFCIVNSQ